MPRRDLHLGETLGLLYNLHGSTHCHLLKSDESLERESIQAFLTLSERRFGRNGHKYISKRLLTHRCVACRVALSECRYQIC